MKIIVIILVLVLSLGTLQAQNSKLSNKKKIISTKQYEWNYSLAFGASFTQLLTNSIGKRSMYVQDDFNPDPDFTGSPKPGGSFDGTQSGLEVRMTLYYGENDKYKVPFGLTYTFFRAKELLPITTSLDALFANSYDMVSPYVGFDYQIKHFWKGNVNLYAGALIKANILFNHEYSRVLRNLNDPEYQGGNDKGSKPIAFRLAPELRLGFEGELANDWYLNFNVGISILNLIGRDGERGEFLTNQKISSLGAYVETIENFEFALQFSLLFQYRI